MGSFPGTHIRPARFLLAVILLLSLALAFSARADGTEIVYDNALGTHWYVGQWDDGCGSHDLSQSSVVHSAPYAFEMNFTCQAGWAAIGLDKRDQYWETLYWMYPNQYQTLSFYLNPGSSTDTLGNLQILLDNSSDEVSLADYLPNPLSPNTWYSVTIPIAALNSSGDRFFRIYFWNTSTAQQPHIYLDDMALSWVDDTTQPVISNVQITDLNWGHATITWQTDEYTESTLQYSYNPGSGVVTSTVTEDDYSLQHSVALTSLIPSTQYQFVITARDHQADPAATPNSATYAGSFTTDPPDVTSPNISGVQVSNIKSSSAMISWTTDEPADSQVEYGVGSYSQIISTTQLTTSHSLALVSLMPQTTYQYRVTSRDEAGNPAEQVGTPFTTADSPTTTMAVTSTVVIHPFTDDMRGANISSWTYYWGRPYPNLSPKLRELTRLIKPGVIRYASGLRSNIVMWDRSNRQCDAEGWCYREYHNPAVDGVDRCSGTEPVTVTGAYDDSYQAEEVDSLAAFAQYVGADIMTEVNVVTCDPDMWADMVRYTRVEHDYPFKYWELGNELDLLTADGTRPDVPVGAEYVARYKRYHASITAQDSNAVVVGPTTAAHEQDSYFNAFANYIDPLTLDAEIRDNDMLGALSYHLYPHWNGQNPVSYTDMFAYTLPNEERSRAHINTCATEKRALLDARGFSGVPIAVSEFNPIAADNYTAYDYNHAGALYVADTLGRLGYSGADMVMTWELYDMPGPGDTSFGMISHHNSTGSRNHLTEEIRDLQDNFAPLPLYYTYFMYAQLFGDHLVQSHSDMEDRLSIWASTDTDEPDALKLMVVNLSDESLHVTINLGDYEPEDGLAYEMTNAAFVAAADKESVREGTSINGLEIDVTSAASILSSAQAILNSGKPVQVDGSTVTYLFPAYSATSIVLNPSATAVQVTHVTADTRETGTLASVSANGSVWVMVIAVLAVVAMGFVVVRKRG